MQGVQVDREWLDFDKVSNDVCTVKVRLFATNEYKDLINGKVSVVVLNSDGQNDLSEVRATSDGIADGSANGYCMVIPCESIRSKNPKTVRGNNNNKMKWCYKQNDRIK